MPLLDFARSLVGVEHEATPVTLAVNPDDRAAGRVPTEGEPLACVVIDLPGSEARAFGLELPQRLRRLFFDPVDGVPIAFDPQSRLRARGELINVLSVQRVESGSMAGTIVNGQVVNE
jgi:hypothetical protein